MSEILPIRDGELVFQRLNVYSMDVHVLCNPMHTQGASDLRVEFRPTDHGGHVGLELLSDQSRKLVCNIKRLGDEPCVMMWGSGGGAGLAVAHLGIGTPDERVMLQRNGWNRIVSIPRDAR